MKFPDEHDLRKWQIESEMLAGRNPKRIMSEPDKPKKPTAEQYHKARIAIALAEVETHPCADCGWPVHSGYCCIYCKSSNPSRGNPESDI